MQLSQMKMTVTLDEAELKKLIAEFVEKELDRPVSVNNVKINVTTREMGNQMNSYTVAAFQNVTIDVLGK